MENSNTLKSFINGGFKIERDGEIITLSLDEMTMFRHLDKSQNGHYSIECLTENDEDYEFAKQFLDNEYLEEEYILSLLLVWFKEM